MLSILRYLLVDRECRIKELFLLWWSPLPLVLRFIITSVLTVQSNTVMMGDLDVIDGQLKLTATTRSVLKQGLIPDHGKLLQYLLCKQQKAKLNKFQYSEIFNSDLL